jgi:D-alanyl-D-alanine dipeptidase
MNKDLENKNQSIESQSGQQELFAPIPLEIPDYHGYQAIEIKENGEPLVAIGPFSGNDFDRFFTSSIYYGERKDSPYRRGALANSLVTTFAREGAAKQLIEAEALLPHDLHLVILDTYRSLDVQQSLYDQYVGLLKEQNPDWTEEQIVAEATQYVSQPSTDPDKPSTHNTGGSIDLAIYRLPTDVNNRVNEINDLISRLDGANKWQEIYKLEMERIGLISQNAELLNFGTKFDWGGPESGLNYFEVAATQRQLAPEEEEARNNRRLLYNIMAKVGFEPFGPEWWHFNSAKTQMGAKTGGLPYAEYGAAQLSEENLTHEQMRRQHITGTEILSTLANSKLGKKLQAFEALAVAQEGEAKLGGHYQKTSLPEAAIIEPPEQKAA